MKQKSWHLNRRTFLKATGVCLALPWLESMATFKPTQPKKRFFAGYFHYGVPMPKDDSDQRMVNGWFPMGTGRDYKLPDMHKPIIPLKSKTTFLSGLYHPNGASPSHKACDSYLTGANIRQSYENQSISIDQYLAAKLGNKTRYKSLVYSTLGGVNRPYRTATLSFDRNGRPIPALNKPKEIFRRLFGTVSAAEKNATVSRGSILDTILEDAKDLDRRLGKSDKSKMEEYLHSVREVELMTDREVSWLDKPKPKMSSEGLNLDVDPSEPKEYLTTMYSLIALALQTDSSRFVTYQATPENTSVTDSFPLAVGISGSAHKLSHEHHNFYDWAKYVAFQNEMYYNFLKKLDSIQEGNSTLLDNTICLYGCTTSKTHQAINFPMILSGGKNMGFAHGQHQSFPKQNFSNLFVTIANQMGVETAKFADSDGELSSLLV